MVEDLIVPEDWFNIPEPIRHTCDGVIQAIGRIQQAIIYNAGEAHKKTVQLQDRVRKFER